MKRKKLKPCPFCGGKETDHPYEKWRKQYKIIYHKLWCYLSTTDHASEQPYNFTLHPIGDETSWNCRKTTESSKGDQG